MSDAPHVVVVDDSRMARMQAESFVRLVRPEWSTQSFPSGDAFLAQMDEGRVPDVMIVDYNMPGSDGLEVLTQVRAKWPETFVVLLTANVQKAVQTAAEELGAHFLAKPVTPDKLKECFAGHAG